jgi:hypothetical protein
LKDTRYFTLTSKAGSFVFETDVYLSHAKIIRDTITACVCDPSKENIPMNNQGAIKWIRDHLMGPASQVQFEWILPWTPAQRIRTTIELMSDRFDLLGVASRIASQKLNEFAAAQA